jgi:hypothetical protein
MSQPSPNGRLHDPDIRELVAELDGFMNVMEERDKRYRDRFLAQDEKTSLALTAAKEAVLKAENATEKRFEAVNEFRSTLSDQAALLMTKAEANSRIGGQDDKLTIFKEELTRLREARSETKGHASGVSATLAMMFAVAGLAIGVLTMLLVRR